MPLLPELLAGAVAGLAVAMPVGPVAVYLLGLAARGPGRTAVAAGLGVASVDGGYAVLAGLGGLALQRRVEPGRDLLAFVGGLVLVVVACWTVWAALRRFLRPAGGPPPRPLTPLRTYGALVAMTAINPTTLLTFAAVVIARSGSVAAGWAATAVFAGGAFVASAGWQLLLVGGGSLLGRLLAGRRGQLLTGVASGAVMLALAGALLAR